MTTAYGLTNGKEFFWWTFRPTRAEAIQQFAGDQNYEPNRKDWARRKCAGCCCVQLELKEVATSEPAEVPKQGELL